MNANNLTAIAVFDIDGVIRDVSNSYRRAIADTVEEFTNGGWRPQMTDLDQLKSEGIWNNDWEASQELIYRYFESQQQSRDKIQLDYNQIVDFFQARYRGTNFDGYIATEPLLVTASYFAQLNNNHIGWGFFSGATRGSAEYVLKRRLALTEPVLVAMEDAPGKPDPQGLLISVEQIAPRIDKSSCPVFYLGDTVADMYTVVRAREVLPERTWIGVGILPPHVQTDPGQKFNYTQKLQQAGAEIVLDNVELLNPEVINELISS